MSDLLHDAIIVGAGAAGLAAAEKLATAGQQIVVLEARRRIGGRIHTIREPGWKSVLEAGAEFIHGSPQETWSIVRALGLATDPAPEQHLTAANGQVAKSDFDEVWQRVGGQLDKLHGPDISFADFLSRDCADLSAHARQQALAYVEGFEAADAQIASALWLREAEQATGQQEGAWRIEGGYSQVVDYLADRAALASARICLGQAVHRIRWQPGDVALETILADGTGPTYRARCVLITVPLGVLQIAAGSIGAIEFVPDVPEKRAVWQQLRMGSVIKVLLRFHEPIWRADSSDLCFLHTPESSFLAWWTSPPRQNPTWTGWTAGTRAAQMAGRPDQAVLDEALGVLERALGLQKPLRDKLADWRVFNWQHDPLAQGAYAYVPTGGMDLPGRLGEPVDQTLFFAGEATERQSIGTVAGALASGYRAADEILTGGRASS